MLRGKSKLTTVFLIAFLTVGGWLLATRLFLNSSRLVGRETPTNDSSQSDPRALNILLLGTDARPGEKLGNTDTIIVAHLEGDRLALLSIPRDTRVNIPGHGWDKINAAYGFGGPELTASVVSELTGVPISKYVLLRWNGFIRIVDLLGGVTVNVPRNMYYYDPFDDPEYKIDLRKGTQHLDGHQALAFVRFREETLGDIDRISQQQELLRAILDKVHEPTVLFKIPQLLSEIYKNIETNMDLDEMLKMAKAGLQIKNMNIVTQTLPGYFLTLNGISYWGVDPRQAREVAHALFERGETTSRIVLDPPSPGPASNHKATSAVRKDTLTSTGIRPKTPNVKHIASPTATPAQGSSHNKPANKAAGNKSASATTKEKNKGSPEGNNKQ